MLQAGNALAARTFEAFLREMEWKREDVDRVVTHQVGTVHRKLLFETLRLDPARDFPTVETLGNTGSAAFPVAFSMAEEAGFLQDTRRVAILGIGSGLSSLMLGVER
jgi:3-oxoacyl-[acyl-carrier-protein] synthase-3